MMSRHREKTTINKPRRGFWNRSFPHGHQKGPTLQVPWPWTSSLQNWERLIFYCLSLQLVAFCYIAQTTTVSEYSAKTSIPWLTVSLLHSLLHTHAEPNDNSYHVILQWLMFLKQLLFNRHIAMCYVLFHLIYTELCTWLFWSPLHACFTAGPLWGQSACPSPKLCPLLALI